MIDESSDNLFGLFYIKHHTTFCRSLLADLIEEMEKKRQNSEMFQSNRYCPSTSLICKVSLPLCHQSASSKWPFEQVYKRTTGFDHVRLFAICNSLKDVSWQVNAAFFLFVLLVERKKSSRTI